jgi:hypothetical protein
MMEELKKRVERLLDGPQIRELIKDYHNKKSQLQTREKADQLDREIGPMWLNCN